MNKQGPGKIEWCDFTWSPVSGCLHGCTYCYASAMARRFKKSFEPAFHPERLKEVEKVPAGSKVFVVSNGDLFGDWVPEKWIEQVLEATATRPDVIYQFLTKNPARYAEFNPWPENCWLGATANAGLDFTYVALHLNKTDAKIKFISAEPLLREPHWNYLNRQLNWLIIGAMTGPQAKQNPPWLTDYFYLRNNARRDNIPIFVKSNMLPYLRDWGEPLIQEWPK